MPSKIISLAIGLFTITSVLYVTCTTGPALHIMEHTITVHEFTGDINQSTATVKGIARNSSNWPISECIISVTLYNYQGNIIAVSSDARQSLGAGEVWNFKVQLKGAEAWDVSRYDISATSK